MSLERLFDHTCEIYHLKKETSDIGFGIKDEETYGYDMDEKQDPVSCHFGVRGSSISTNQGEPMNELDARIKLTLPIGTDIRVNDKIISRQTGYAYIAETPRNIRGHHITVNIKRMKAAEGAL
ncbi:MAG: DUF3599 family protein [Lachnospiraceae bacterium]